MFNTRVEDVNVIIYVHIIFGSDIVAEWSAFGK